MTDNFYKYLLSFVLILSLGSCTILEGPEDISNPLDPNDPDFEPPSVTFIQAPVDGSTVDTSFVLFDWEGSQSSMNYSYRMDDREWSEWSSDSAVEYQLLDEGPHDFLVKSRYFNGVESDDPQSISFSVDDLNAPAITLLPRYITAILNQSVDVEIQIHEVTDLALSKVILEYDPNQLLVNAITVYESASFLAKNGGAVIPFYSNDVESGQITIEVGVATGNPTGVSGSGPIAKISLTSTTSSASSLQFSQVSEFRDAQNTTIQIGDFGHGGVYVQ